MSTPSIFVCGVTGTQGGVVARLLRARDIEVHALARDPAADKAKAVEALGVKLWHGDFDNQEALDAAMKGCTAVFLNLMPDFADLASETRWANAILDSAKKAGVEHVVYSSGFGLKNFEGHPMYDAQSLFATVMRNKATNEEVVRAAGFNSWTILRPGNFMSNFLTPAVRMYPGLLEQGVWTTAMTSSVVLPMTDPETVGKFSVEALLDPSRFHAQDVCYADELVGLDALMVDLSRATGRDLKVAYLTEEEIETQRKVNPFVVAQFFMRDMALQVDMEEVKKWGIPLSTFREFLEREDARVRETYQQSVQ